MGRRRIDQLLTEAGLVDSREKAKRLILAGEVLADNVPIDKPGTLVDERAALRLRKTAPTYVGRGGEKLAGAIQSFGLELNGLHVLDIGASTGGFTDCALQHGAATVIALDVGVGQLHWKLVADSRVQRFEKVNARYLNPDAFADRPIDLVTIDVSFISLVKILPAVTRLVVESDDRKGLLVAALIKPQFELSPEKVGKGGIVRDPKRHAEAIRRVCDAASDGRFETIALAASPITGMEGNREFFVLLKLGCIDLPLAPLSGESLLQRVAEICEKGPLASSPDSNERLS